MNKINKKKWIYLILIIPYLFSIPADAEQVKEEKEKVNYPETEIFLFDLKISADAMQLSNGENVTTRPGYDNQPYFTKDSKSFVYSRDDGYQTDVYEYNIGQRKSQRLTQSDNTEFSPTPFPSNDHLAFVTDRSNSIWFAARDNLENPEWVFAKNPIHEPIGYFSWNHTSGDILYWSQYGFNVTLAHESKKDVHYISGNAIPSTPHVIPGTNKFSFVHRQGNGEAWIKELDPTDRSIRPLTSIVGSNANYAWAPDGSIIMIEGSKLYRWHPENTTNWRMVSDLSQHGIQSANRVAVSPNSKHLAVVGIAQQEPDNQDKN